MGTCVSPSKVSISSRIRSWSSILINSMAVCPIPRNESTIRQYMGNNWETKSLSCYDKVSIKKGLFITIIEINSARLWSQNSNRDHIEQKCLFQHSSRFSAAPRPTSRSVSGWVQQSTQQVPQINTTLDPRTETFIIFKVREGILHQEEITSKIIDSYLNLWEDINLQRTPVFLAFHFYSFRRHKIQKLGLFCFVYKLHI